MPLYLNSDDTHMIDRPVNLVETLVQVFDRGTWVADLNVLGALNSGITRMGCKVGPDADGHTPDSTYISHSKQKVGTLISIDTWDELLDPPQQGSIITRAYGNWLARLATTGVCKELGYTIVILSRDTCWSCYVEQVAKILSQAKISSLKPMEEQDDDAFTPAKRNETNKKAGEGKLALIQ
jgi:hypothetical protein